MYNLIIQVVVEGNMTKGSKTFETFDDARWYIFNKLFGAKVVPNENGFHCVIIDNSDVDEEEPFSMVFGTGGGLNGVLKIEKQTD